MGIHDEQDRFATDERLKKIASTTAVDLRRVLESKPIRLTELTDVLYWMLREARRS